MRSNTALILAVVTIISVLIGAFTILALDHVDTSGYVGFIQLMFGATTSIIGVLLVKRTGQAVDTATQATAQVQQVSEQVREVKQIVNGNTAALIAKVGPVHPENDVVITEISPGVVMHERPRRRPTARPKRQETDSDNGQ